MNRRPPIAMAGTQKPNRSIQDPLQSFHDLNTATVRPDPRRIATNSLNAPTGTSSVYSECSAGNTPATDSAVARSSVRAMSQPTTTTRGASRRPRTGGGVRATRRPYRLSTAELIALAYGETADVCQHSCGLCEYTRDLRYLAI
jgi:hypothetical protein